MSVRDELVRLTKELVRIPSVSDDPAGRLAVVDYIESFCRDLPGVQTFRYESRGIPSLVAAFDDERAKSLILNAHVDVVPARHDQFEPYERDGRVYGRGTQDMKAAAAAMLLVLRDLARAGQRPSVSWQFVTDEEVGGDDGTGYLFQSGYTGDFFLAGEPTDLEIVNRAKGILWVTVRQQGNPAHGSRPWDGSNPIPPLASGLARLLERYPIPAEPVWQTTVTPAAIQGGDAHNRVPVDCLLKLDVRRIPEDPSDEILRFLRQCFEGAQVEVYHDGSVLSTTETDTHVASLQSLVIARLGRHVPFRNEHFGSDARFYSEAGIPAVCFGPAGRGLHSHDEWVDVASLVQYYEIIADLARSYAPGRPGELSDEG